MKYIRKQETNTSMTKEELNKNIDDTLQYFINGNERGFVTNKELDDMRYAISKVREHINEEFFNEQ